ncbi:MAG: transcriptional regulator [Candidatus Helarchaeota archaeon]|nr:transcriptional regulator [Candidatus Helarchaeota archaeon]
MVQDRENSNNGVNSIDAINKMIHEPARLLIISHLYVLESADFVFLRAQTGLTWGNLSSHISKLEEAGYVSVKKEFIMKKPHTMVSLTKEGRIAFEQYRKEMKNLLS